MKSQRGHWIVIFVLVCMTGYFAWRYLTLQRQLATASFIQHQIDTTQRSYVVGASDVRGLALRLNFLRGYFDEQILAVDDPVLRRSLERDYRETLTNAMIALRGLTNDLGDDLDVWIETYGQ